MLRIAKIESVGRGFEPRPPHHSLFTLSYSWCSGSIRVLCRISDRA